MTDAKKSTTSKRRWSDATNVKRAQSDVETLKQKLLLAQKRADDLRLKQEARNRWRILGDMCRPLMEEGNDPPELRALADAVLVRDEDRARFKLAPLPVSGNDGVQAPSGSVVDVSANPSAESKAGSFVDAVSSANDDLQAEIEAVEACPATGTGSA